MAKLESVHLESVVKNAVQERIVTRQLTCRLAEVGHRHGCVVLVYYKL